MESNLLVGWPFIGNSRNDVIWMFSVYYFFLPFLQLSSWCPGGGSGSGNGGDEDDDRDRERFRFCSMPPDRFTEEEEMIKKKTMLEEGIINWVSLVGL